MLAVSSPHLSPHLLLISLDIVMGILKDLYTNKNTNER